MFRVAKSVTTRLATCATLSAWATLSLGLLAGCHNGSNAPSTAPTSAAGSQSGGPPSGAGSYTISGVVAENGQPVANVSVNAWMEQLGGAGYSYWYLHGQVHTDASGGYRMTSLPGGAHVWIQLNKDGYVQQCAASAIMSGDLTMDVALLSTARVTASPMPSTPGLRSVSGTVVEMTATGSQPVAGAGVVFGAGAWPEPAENPAAYTDSDTTGRFALCGLPANDTVKLEGVAGTRVGYVSVAPGQTSDIQITLPSSMSSIMAQ